VDAVIVVWRAKLYIDLNSKKRAGSLLRTIYFVGFSVDFSPWTEIFVQFVNYA
jgi:hypothetical protein